MSMQQQCDSCVVNPRSEVGGALDRPKFTVRCWVSVAAAVLALVGATGSGLGLQSVMANPVEPYGRLLPLELNAPPVAQAGRPLSGIGVRLQNPGREAPSSRLRLIIHDKDHGPANRELNPGNVKVEVQEGGKWKPVLLEVVDGGVMGAIGSEAGADHRERHKRGGFEIKEKFDKRWPLRITFGMPGTYTLVVSVSPDNGSRHIAQPAHANIEVQ